MIMRIYTPALLVLVLSALAACSSGSSDTAAPPGPQPPAAATVTVTADLKQLTFSWAAVTDATHYRFYEDADGNSGFTQMGADITAGTLSVTLALAAHLQDFANALYMLEACNANGCTASNNVSTLNVMLDTIGYLKASNTESNDNFGIGNGAPGVALSADGTTIAVGAFAESSVATGVGGNQSDNTAAFSGAVYVFRFDGTTWSQQAYVKASNSEAVDAFGWAVALSADGNTLAVGSFGEDSAATGVGGDQNDNTTSGSGAVYVYGFDGMAWSQQAYIKASNTESADSFGQALALSDDGTTLAVSAVGEASNATGIGGNQMDNSADGSGAVYLFRFNGMTWAQQAYIKASNAEISDLFGDSVALSANGNVLAVGASAEASAAVGIGGDQINNSASAAGAVYVFAFDGANWSQQAYVKASNTESGDSFGSTVALNASGNTLAVGAWLEQSNATGIDGSQLDNSAVDAGAAYLFRFDGTLWSQQAYVKASNTDAVDNFGISVALDGSGNTLAVGAFGEGAGVGGDQLDNMAPASGAVYVLRFEGTNWMQRGYVKASNPEADDAFGGVVALSDDGATLAVAAQTEDSNASGIGGDASNNLASDSGAVYVY